MGGWEIFTRNGEKPGMIGRGLWKNFKISWHSRQRGTNPPIIRKPPFFKTSLHCHFLQLLPHFSFCWPVSWWSNHIWCAILLNDNKDLQMLGLDTIVPEGPWCVFYATRVKFTEVWHMLFFFYWYSDFVITHTNTYHTLGQLDWHTHMNIFLHHLLCAHSSYLNYIKWLNEKFTDVFSFQKLFTCKSHVSVN